MKKKTFKELLEESRKRDEYWIARTKLEFTENLRRLLEEKKETKAGLAKKLGKSPAYITKIFRGNVNFTLESMVRLVRAMGGRLKIELEPEATKQVQPELKGETYVYGLILPEQVRTYAGHRSIERNLIDWINSQKVRSVCTVQTEISAQLTPAIPKEEKIERNFATA
jgi:transcriptional regulator with XRE-family HTH domain